MLRNRSLYQVIILDVGFEIVLLVAFWTTAANGFSSSHQHKPTNMVSLILEGRHRGCGFQYSTLFSSDADDNLWFEGSESSPLEAMRRILEVSWDVHKMGRVPLDATEGANEVYSALLEAFSVTGDESGIYMVELLAPSYDVTQGERMYDEVGGNVDDSGTIRVLLQYDDALM